MRRICPVASLALAAALSASLGGCSWGYSTGASSGAGAATPAAAGAAEGGTVVAGGTGLYVSVSLGQAAANIMVAATGAAIYAAMLHEGGEWRPAWRDRPMREDRTVNEQDCAKPVTNAQANLKCK